MTREELNEIRFKQITFEGALQLVSDTKSQREYNTRKKLIDVIGEKMYFSLCRLGYITEGATINEYNQRIAVWGRTDKKSPRIISAISSSDQPSEEALLLAMVL